MIAEGKIKNEPEWESENVDVRRAPGVIGVLHVLRLDAVNRGPEAVPQHPVFTL